MFWLVVIWIVAALCGLAAAAVWEPLLSMALAIARTVDPGFASYLAQYAAIVESGGEAIGWLVALVVGLPLTLLWLVLRVVGSALRGPDDRRREERRPDVRDRPSARPGAHRGATPRPAPSVDAERHDPPAPRGSTFDVSSRSSATSRGTDASSRGADPSSIPPPPPPSRDRAARGTEPVRPDPEPRTDRSPSASAPRWGRQ